MKVRDSGMPEREVWERFFDPERILMALGMGDLSRDVAEFGCGYGTFTIAAAKMISGTLYALDIEPEMIRVTEQACRQQGIDSVRTIQRDFVADGTGLPPESVDCVMLFNILHLEEPMTLIQEARRILRPGGRLAIIHWNPDPSTPKGPAMDIRPRPEQCLRWAEDGGFGEPLLYDLKPYHYGIVLRRMDRSVLGGSGAL